MSSITATAGVNVTIENNKNDDDDEEVIDGIANAMNNYDSNHHPRASTLMISGILSSTALDDERNQHHKEEENERMVSAENYTNNNNINKNDYGEIISALSNLSIQYNFGCIAPALLLLDHTRVAGHHDDDNGSGSSSNIVDALYPRTKDQDSLLKSAVFVGAILGQCSMGFIGDALFGSLTLAMMFTNALALVGTLGWCVLSRPGMCL